MGFLLFLFLPRALNFLKGGLSVESDIQIHQSGSQFKVWTQIELLLGSIEHHRLTFVREMFIEL